MSLATPANNNKFFLKLLIERKDATREPQRARGGEGPTTTTADGAHGGHAAQHMERVCADVRAGGALDGPGGPHPGRSPPIGLCPAGHLGDWLWRWWRYGDHLQSKARERSSGGYRSFHRVHRHRWAIKTSLPLFLFCVLQRTCSPLCDGFKQAKKRLEGKAEVEFVEANAEKLPFDDASFDRYMASFVLHLVTDPKSMLAECKRVLQPGKGMAAFSVWGRKEHSPHFTIVPEVAKRLGIDLTQVGGAKPEMRSNFHLGDDPAALRRMALEAGFSKAFTWYQFVPVDVTDGRGWAEKQMHCSPMIIKLMRTLPEEKAAEFKNALADAADEFYNNGNVVGMEALFLLALA